MVKTTPKIKIQNLHKSFGEKKVLTGINLEVYNQESLVILGGSGCGKSVLIKSVAGILEPDEGSVFIDGIDITKLHGNKKT